MKKALYFLFMLITAHSFGQTAKTVFETDKLVWFGLDFTKSKMIGIVDASPSSIKEQFFRAWNGIVLEEPQKFDLSRFFKKPSVIRDLEPVEKRNKRVD